MPDCQGWTCGSIKFININKTRINWDKLAEESAVLGLSKHLYYGLYFVRHIFEADIPEYVIERLRPSKVSLLEKKFVASVVSGRADEFQVEFALLGMNKSIRDRIYFSLRLLFPSRTELAFIKQKDVSEVGCGDYLRRLFSAFRYTIRFITRH